MGYYGDLREYIETLEAKDKLFRIKREIHKDTELVPLVRWQFQGLPERKRKAFLFENVIGARGKRYTGSVLVAAHAPSREIYAIGMKCHPEEITDRWAKGQLHPIEPNLGEKGPVQEEIHIGDGLLSHDGLEEFPIPLTTPGFDNAPYLSAACWVSKDPETGIRNVGVYRGMVKSNTRLGINCLAPQHLRTHWEKCREKGIPLQAAIVIGALPAICYAGVNKLPYGLDEYTVAGGIMGEPVTLVKCKTVDLEVPANAEIVIEGKLPTDSLEREGPHAEHTGYVGLGQPNPYFNATCITHRKNPIYTVFVDQFPPSEDTKIRQIGYEATYYKFLRHDCNIPGILEVAFHEESGGAQFIVIRMKKRYTTEAWQALNGAAAFNPLHGKYIIAVDDDIDPRDLNSVLWALCYRVQPHQDIRITPGKTAALDPSAIIPEKLLGSKERAQTSAMLIDATRKWEYPPVALPKKEFMEGARRIWEEEGLPSLEPSTLWFGYSLGAWTEEYEEEAELALRGEHYVTGEKLARERIRAKP